MPKRRTPKSSPSDNLQQSSQLEQLEHSETVSVEVVEFEELTEDEQCLRLHLERKVERAFYEAGKALMELRDKLLFRSTHKTFEDYCRDRFGFERRHPYRLIDAAIVIDNLSQMCPNWTQNELGNQDFNGLQILPTNECQVRPLTKLEPEQQREAWEMAVTEAGMKVPSGRIVKDVVERIMERTKVPNPYRVGEVCQILPKDNPELKGKGGYWCIVTHVGDCSCTIATWDTEYVVKLEHIKSFDYLEEECAFMGELQSRMANLHQLGHLDAAAYWILNGLGKLTTLYLTPIQEKLLEFLEQEYGIL